MPICTIIATTILNCAVVAPLPPAEAVKVLTSNTQPWIAPPPMPTAYEFAMRNLPLPPPNPNSPFLTPATPIAPLAPPWRVTTHYGRYGGESFFNGRPFVESPASAPSRAHRAR